nr:hypothetical protein [Tanacetum cinerariifolium]
MVRNVDSPSKFLMYLRFLQLIINHKVDDLTSHNTKYRSPALIQKAAEEDEDVEVPTAPVPPSPITAPLLPPQDPTPTPHASPSSPTQEQPTETSKSSIPLLNTLLETCATLFQKVAELEQDKHTQELEIIKLKKRVKKLEKKKKSRSSGFNMLRKINTSHRVESSTDSVIDQDVSVVATKDVCAAEPTVFDDEEVTMTMDQTLIKMKSEKAKLLDEQIAQRLHDEEIEKAKASEKQKNMIWKELKCFNSSMMTKRKPLTGMLEYKKVQTLFKPDKDVEKPTKKRVAKNTLLQESFKKLKAVEVSESRSYWKIIRVGGITYAYQSFEDMLKGFDKEYLVALWSLVKEKFILVVLNVDKEKALWVELKSLFEPDADDVLWKLQRERLSLVKWSHDPDAECKVTS